MTRDGLAAYLLYAEIGRDRPKRSKYSFPKLSSDSGKGAVRHGSIDGISLWRATQHTALEARQAVRPAGRWMTSSESNPPEESALGSLGQSARGAGELAFRHASLVRVADGRHQAIPRGRFESAADDVAKGRRADRAFFRGARGGAKTPSPRCYVRSDSAMSPGKARAEMDLLENVARARLTIRRREFSIEYDCREMVLPERIAEQIRAIVASTPTVGGHIDNEAAKYGGVAVMGTIGAVWLLRPDGTIWEVDDDFGRPLVPVPPEWHHAAVACGAERYPWLADLVPPRPADAIPCSTCHGRGKLRTAARPNEAGVLCPQCYARGWQ